MCSDEESIMGSEEERPDDDRNTGDSPGIATETPVCWRCMRPCDPGSYYCPHCGSTDPVNSLTPYMPFVNIPFNYSIFGEMWRGGTGQRPMQTWKRIFCWFILLLCVPFFLVIAVPLYLIGLVQSPRLRNVLNTAFWITLGFLLLLLLLYHVLDRPESRWPTITDYP